MSGNNEKKSDKKPEAKVRERPRVFEDFSHEYLNNLVIIRLHDGTELSAIITKASRYWFRALVNGELIYVNKAYVVYVRPKKPTTK